MSKQQRRSYDKPFKKMAVELYLNGKSAGEVAKDLGIGVDMVRRRPGSIVKMVLVAFQVMGNKI